VTLNRPEVLNAFNQKMRDELKFVWRALRYNDDVRVVVLTAAGTARSARASTASAPADNKGPGGHPPSDGSRR
jgi:enoyl-CoA hydratase/carnithine racemase